jgi:hypothetical protein
MADSMVAGLFGLTPEMYQNQQYQQDLKRGYELAQLSPGAAAQAGLQASVGQLGRGVAGLMGVEDPQMKIISARQQILGGLDQTNPTSMLRGAKMLAQMGDQQGAFALADYARKAQSEIAQAQQRLAAANRERQQATPEKLLISDRIAELNTQLDLLTQQPQSPDRDAQINLTTRRLEAIEKQIEKPEKPENKTEIQRLQEYAATLPAGSPLLAQVQAVIKAKSEPPGTKITNLLPGQPVPTKDWMDFTQNVLSKDPIMQDTSRVLSEGPKLINIINSATSNDISAAALPKALSAFIGKDSSLSNLDIQTFARTGGLDNRLASDVNKFFTGRATEVKKEQAQQFAIALYRGALIERKKKLQTASEEFGYLTSPNYKFALKNIDEQLDQFKLVKKGETQPSTQKTGNPLVDKWLSTDAEKK